MNTHPNSRSAFTLIEMTIVLAVIGFIVGGVLIGQGMIRASQTARVARELTQYDSATQQFITRYKAWPGDMVNATQYWGIAGGSTGNDSSCYNVASTNKLTCNGNGDRIISDLTSAPNSVNERFRYWQHLANAGLISGQFTGKPVVNNTNNTAIGVNVPGSVISRSGYNVLSEYNATLLANSYFDSRPIENIMFSGAQMAGSDLYAPNLTAGEAADIDSKMDDGMPGTGIIQAPRSTSPTSPNCSSSAVANTATYKLSASGKVCNLFYFLNRGLK